MKAAACLQAPTSLPVQNLTCHSASCFLLLPLKLTVHAASVTTAWLHCHTAGHWTWISWLATAILIMNTVDPTHSSAVMGRGIALFICLGRRLVESHQLAAGGVVTRLTSPSSFAICDLHWPHTLRNGLLRIQIAGLQAAHKCHATSDRNLRLLKYLSQTRGILLAPLVYTFTSQSLYHEP
jgi:hypothetical protein